MEELTEQRQVRGFLPPSVGAVENAEEISASQLLSLSEAQLTALKYVKIHGYYV